jgi:hypothetical protein
MFFEFSSKLFECSLNVLPIFECSLNLESNLQVLFKYSWSNFGKVLMFGELISNELGSASIYSGLMKKSPLETSTLEETWSILIGQKSESLTRTY